MRLFLAAGLLLIAPHSLRAEVGDDVAALRTASSVEPATPAMQAAWRRLAETSPAEMTKLLAGMKDAAPAAENWLRAAVDAIGERALAEGALPVGDLRQFLADTRQSPRARRAAFDWIIKADPSQEKSLLEGMLDDPSLALRYDAVAQLLAQTDALPAEQAAAKKEAYQTALSSARDPKQLEEIKDALSDLGDEVDLASVYGFLKEWRVIGPFDNTGLAHFGTVYPPEEKQDVSAEYDGKLGKVTWQEHTAEDGVVDFVDALGKEKEAIAYALTTFTADQAGSAEIRYETRNASKVWLNGELIASTEVYHSGSGFDQYRVPVDLKPGQNTLLLKIAQNEQKMPWEREWEFRLRVVDKLGTPVGKQIAELVSSALR